MNTGNYKFVHIGNCDIKKELFIDISNDGNKLYGGFWACPNNNVEGSISDRTDYILENMDKKFLRYNVTKGCFFNLKENAKVLCLLNDNDVKKVKEKYLNHKYINFEEISKDYDALYVNPFSLSYNLRQNEFYNWNIRSLVIFNLDCIDEYVPFEFEIIANKGSYIRKLNEPKKISPLVSNYCYIKSAIYELFKIKLEKESNGNEINIEKIKFELMNELKDIVDNSSFDMIEAIIVNECNSQKKILRKS